MRKIFMYLLLGTVFSVNGMKDRDRALKLISEESNCLCRMDDERDKALSLQNKIAESCQKNGDVENYGELKVENNSHLNLTWIEFSCEEDGLQVLVTVLKDKNNGEVQATASCIRFPERYCTYTVSLVPSSSLVELLKNKKAANKSGYNATFKTIDS